MEFKGYSTLWKAVIRPPRFEYEVKDLGPTEFVINNNVIQRTDIDFRNEKGLILKCSHFEPLEASREWEQMPCVIYLHGNSSSRMESLETVPYLLPSNITLFCFDFAGCGISEGEYISLGWYEREDLGLIVDFLRKNRRTSTIGLWGRSMGAVTSLLYGDRDPSIGGMILDSPFSNMKILVTELAKTHTKIPSFLVSGAMKLVRNTIKGKANFDINDLSPIDHVANCFIPALFAHAEGDDFIQPHHSKDLVEKYSGDKNITTFPGDHNSQRPNYFLDSVAIFFYQALQVEELLTEATKLKKEIKPKKQPSDYEDSYFQNLEHIRAFQMSMGSSPFNQDALEGMEVGAEDDPLAGMDPNSEEYILKFVMLESMKQHEEEERKRKEPKQEEEYLLECMQKEESKEQPAKPKQSIDDLLNM